jgi:hypothetical protein
MIIYRTHKVHKQTFLKHVIVIADQRQKPKSIVNHVPNLSNREIIYMKEYGNNVE